MITVQFRHKGRVVPLDEIRDKNQKTVLGAWGNRIGEIVGPLHCPDCGTRCWAVFQFSAFERVGGTEVEDVCHEGFRIEIEKAFAHIEGPLHLSTKP